MIVLLTEEQSMREVLESLIARHFPERVKGVDWLVLAFSGKSDLEKNIPIKMRGWSYGNPFFVILRDADGSDFLTLKKRLEDIALPTRRHFKVRVVCQELESWLIGDCDAIKTAYPRSSVSNNQERYRNPDRLTNAAEELTRITEDSTKVQRARQISRHLDPSRNRSHSFQVLFETLQQHLGS